MTLRFGLKEPAIQKICNVLSRYPLVQKATLYGSRAKGNYKNGSDIDLTLHGRGLSLDLVYNILNDFEDLLLPYTIDMSIFDDIRDPDVVDHIRRVGVTFYEKGEERVPELAGS